MTEFQVKNINVNETRNFSFKYKLNFYDFQFAYVKSHHACDIFEEKKVVSM